MSNQITKPAVLPIWASMGDQVQPANSDIQMGWQKSTIPPSRQRFNWILSYVMQGVRYLCRRGMADWDAAETYMTNDRVIGDDGNTYYSLTDNNTGNVPSTSPTAWDLWGFTKSQADSRYALKTQGGILTVRLVDTVGVPLSGLQVVDGVQTVAGDLVLRAVGNNAANMIYVVGTGTWQQYALANIKAGSLLSVQEGTANADTQWELQTDGTINLGTTKLKWADITGSMRAAIASLQSTMPVIGTSSGQIPSFNSNGAVTLGSSWSVGESGGVLFFFHNGTKLAKLDGSGNLTVAGDVKAFGAI